VPGEAVQSVDPADAVDDPSEAIAFVVCDSEPSLGLTVGRSSCRWSERSSAAFADGFSSLGSLDAAGEVSIGPAGVAISRPASANAPPVRATAKSNPPIAHATTIRGRPFTITSVLVGAISPR
jgi:hypothetical protein